MPFGQCPVRTPRVASAQVLGEIQVFLERFELHRSSARMQEANGVITHPQPDNIGVRVSSLMDVNNMDLSNRREQHFTREFT